MSCKCFKACKDVNEEVDFRKTEYLRSKTGNLRINNDPRNLNINIGSKEESSNKSYIFKNTNENNNNNDIMEPLKNQTIKEEDEEKENEKEENKNIKNNIEIINTMVNENQNKSKINVLGNSIEKVNNDKNSEKSKINSCSSIKYINNFDKTIFFTKNLLKAEKIFEHPINYEKDWTQYCDDSDNEEVYLFINSMNTSHVENQTNNEGQVIEYRGEKYLYKGEIGKKQKPIGFGVLYTMNGEKYEGNFSKGKLIGLGRYIDKNGTCYEGIFKDNKIISKAKIIKFNEKGQKISYFGDVSNFKKEGKGQETCKDYIYTGEFKQDLRHGHGNLKFLENGDIYEGDFNMGEMTGTGKYIWKNQQVYNGEFLKGIKHGKGKYEWPDGYEYEGDYNNGIREGFGIYKWKDGKVFKGQFKNGKPNGKGKLTYKGKTMDIEYIDGRPTKDIMELFRRSKKDI